MQTGDGHLAAGGAGATGGWSAALACPCAPPEPFPPAALRAFVFAGENESDAPEEVLARIARVEGALELEMGEGLEALRGKDQGLISLGFSCLGDYARAILDLRDTKARTLAQLARELRTRPLLRAAVRSGEVRIRAAETVLPVARGDAEAGWVERARTETVRALARAVREARVAAGEEEDEWVRLRVRMAPPDRAVVDEALAIAAHLLPGSSRAQRLEAMAQEYLGEHPLEAGDDTGRAGASFRREVLRAVREEREARLEAETERWSYLPRVPDVAAPEAGFDGLSALEIDARLRELAALRARWDGLLGYFAYVVKRSGLWREAGFDTFEHYCKDRLGLSPRTVEQRAALEKQLWVVPALWEARRQGLPYEKLRILARLPPRELAEWIPRAWTLTCVALRDAIDGRCEAQMRAARILGARVPGRVATLLAAAFRAVRAVEGCVLGDAPCLVRVARHFSDVWRGHVKKPRTRSQKVRARDGGRCQVPGCSRLGGHGHHIIPRSHGGTDDPWNLVSLCACHHQRGIHGGWMRVRGRAPDRLIWEVRGKRFRAGAVEQPPEERAYDA